MKTARETMPRTFLHVQEYAAPADIPENVQRRRLNELLAAAREVFAVPRENVALKTRAARQGRQQVSDQTSIRAANSSPCAKAVRDCA